MISFMVNFYRTHLDNRQNQLSSFTVGNPNELFKQGENPQKKFFFQSGDLKQQNKKSKDLTSYFGYSIWDSF